MKVQRALITTGVGLLAAGIAATAYSPAALAASTVSCESETNYLDYWFNCASSNGTQTIWYVNGVRQSSMDGKSIVSFACNKWKRYTVSVNSGTSLAASWTGYCEQP
jgi:hypothetical protein